MTSNMIKLIACICMLIDHIGYFLFPEIIAFRYIGRLAMPLFAFFIAEGCKHTSSPFKYFLRTALVGIACQAVTLSEQILNGRIYWIYFNILITFSFSIIICTALRRFMNAAQTKNKTETCIYGIGFIVAVALIIGLDILFSHSASLFGVSIEIDYGATGALLPVFAMLSKNKWRNLLYFSIGVVLYISLFCKTIPFTWIAIFALIPLVFYNGQRGKRNFKYAFYLFYPVHIAVIYAIDVLFFG